MRRIFAFILFWVFLIFVINSCSDCKSWGDNNLGGEFTLLEGDKVDDRIIIYCIGRENPNDCCTGGIPIIPSREDKKVNYIESANYNDKWLIAKGIHFDKTVSYWILNKSFDTSWEYDDGGIFYNRIQSNVYGPYDWVTFTEESEQRGIELRF